MMNSAALQFHTVRDQGPDPDESPGRALLSADQESELAEAIAKGDLCARSRLVRANMRLVTTIARDFLGRGMALEDLIGEGNLGLIRAAQRFDPRFGTRFSTYARYWIKEAIQQALINTLPTIRLPNHVVRRLSQWRRAKRSLRRVLGGDPTPDQIAVSLGLNTAQQALMEQALRVTHVCRQHGRSDAGLEWSPDELQDPHEAPEASLEEAEERHDLRRRLDQLDDRERTILILRFGLEGEPPLTLKAVSLRTGVSREKVRQIEVAAVRKLDPALAPP